MSCYGPGLTTIVSCHALPFVQGFVKQLLDVADNMGRALEVVPPRQEAEQLDVERAVKLLTGLQEGVQATESILLSVSAPARVGGPQQRRREEGERGYSSSGAQRAPPPVRLYTQLVFAVGIGLFLAAMVPVSGCYGAVMGRIQSPPPHVAELSCWSALPLQH